MLLGQLRLFLRTLCPLELEMRRSCFAITCPLPCTTVLALPLRGVRQQLKISGAPSGGAKGYFNGRFGGRARIEPGDKSWVCRFGTFKMIVSRVTLASNTFFPCLKCFGVPSVSGPS